MVPSSPPSSLACCPWGTTQTSFLSMPSSQSLSPFSHLSVLCLSCHNIMPHRSAPCAMNDSYGNHPRCPQPPDVVHEWLLKANIIRLIDGGASSHEVLNLHPELLDPVNYQCHHLTLATVKDEVRDDVLIQSCCKVRLQHLVDPCNHHCLGHPGGILAAVKVCCWVCCKLILCNATIATIWFPLKNNKQQEHHTNPLQMSLPLLPTSCCLLMSGCGLFSSASPLEFAMHSSWGRPGFDQCWRWNANCDDHIGQGDAWNMFNPLPPPQPCTRPVGQRQVDTRG